MILLGLLRGTMTGTQYQMALKCSPVKKKGEKKSNNLKNGNSPNDFWHVWVGKDPHKSHEHFELTVITWLGIYFWEARRRERPLYSDHKEERSWGIINEKKKKKGKN